MNYPGSKNRLSRYIAPILMKYRERRVYLEPFVGICGMMQAIRGGERIASDDNESLIMMWQGFQSGTFNPPVCVSREVYKQLKVERESSALKGYVGIAFSHMGQWYGSYHAVNNRENLKGKFRPETGPSTYRHILHRVHDVEFHAGSYEMWDDAKDCLIYCDPPYKGTATNCYHINDFDHDNFWKWCTKMSQKNRVLVSEMSAPEDWKPIWSVSREWFGDMTKGRARPIKTEHLFAPKDATWL